MCTCTKIFNRWSFVHVFNMIGIKLQTNTSTNVVAKFQYATVPYYLALYGNIIVSLRLKLYNLTRYYSDEMRLYALVFGAFSALIITLSGKGACIFFLNVWRRKIPSLKLEQVEGRDLYLPYLYKKAPGRQYLSLHARLTSYYLRLTKIHKTVTGYFVCFDLFISKFVLLSLYSVLRM